MFRPEELFELQQKQGEALVSIIAPMERIYPASDKNPILMKNLIRETERKLSDGYDPVRAKGIVEKIHQLEHQIDYKHTQEGLALFVSEDTAKVFHLPFAPRERVNIGNSFHTRDLLLAYNQNPQYLLLVFSLENVRLFRGVGQNLKEIINKDFPATYAGPSRTEPLSKITRQDIDSEELGDLRIFLNQVDDHLYEIVHGEKTPLFAVGEAEYIAYLKDRDKSGKSLRASLNENLAHFTEGALVDKVFPMVQAYVKEECARQVELFQEAIGYQKAAQGIREVWRAAKLGQILTLIIEERFSQPAHVLTDNELELELVEMDGQRKARYHEDIVDDVIELVLQMGGQAVFIEDGRLAGHGHIGAILRYERIMRDNSNVSNE